MPRAPLRRGRRPSCGSRARGRPRRRAAGRGRSARPGWTSDAARPVRRAARRGRPGRVRRRLLRGLGQLLARGGPRGRRARALTRHLGFGCLLLDQAWLARGGIEIFGALGRVAAERSQVPVSLLLNEAHSLEHALRGIDAGFNTVMLATSDVEPIAALVRHAHERGVAVEGELGTLPDGNPARRDRRSRRQLDRSRPRPPRSSRPHRSTPSRSRSATSTRSRRASPRSISTASARSTGPSGCRS